MLRVVIGLVLLHVLMTVRVFALQEVWHVVIVARTSAQVVVMETVQLIVSHHVITQKYSMTQKKDEKLEMYL